MARFQDSVQQGIRADQPLATAVGEGTLYGVIDEGDIIERSDGAAWQPYSPTATGTVLQVINVQTGAVASGSTTIPFDDTIPEKTEGDEYMTLAVTPTSAMNKLKIEVFVWASPSVARFVTAALFQDTTTNALAAMSQYQTTGTGVNVISFSHYMTAGTTSATTFKIRAGADSAATVTFNGQSAGRKLGGVAASSITITEILV